MLDYLPEFEIRKQLSFCEANIVIENLFPQTTQGDLIARLDTLSKNTQDERLLAELRSLIEKIKDLTPQEFSKLKRDKLTNNLLFPADYLL